MFQNIPFYIFIILAFRQNVIVRRKREVFASTEKNELGTKSSARSSGPISSNPSDNSFFTKNAETNKISSQTGKADVSMLTGQTENADTNINAGKTEKVATNVITSQTVNADTYRNTGQTEKLHSNFVTGKTERADTNMITDQTENDDTNMNTGQTDKADTNLVTSHTENADTNTFSVNTENANTNMITELTNEIGMTSVRSQKMSNGITDKPSTKLKIVQNAQSSGNARFITIIQRL